MLYFRKMPLLTLTFLGTGTSQGVPMIGCNCPICSSSDPRDQRTRTSLLVGTAQHQILIDTTPDLRTQCLREKIDRVDAVLFTHSHTDHMMGFDDLRRFCELQEIAMPIYAAPFTMGKLREAFSFAFDNPKPSKNYLRLAPHPIDGSFFLGELEIVPVPLVHGAMITLGFVFKHQDRKLLAYFTDCKAVSPEAVEEAAGVEVLILDALRERPHPTHLNFEEALQAAQQIKAAQTYFTHCCHDVSHAAKEAELPATVRIAYDGLKITI
jgi:phosphoribosyl 1,2-cyclic phosphate phosphodiesterase